MAACLGLYYDPQGLFYGMYSDTDDGSIARTIEIMVNPSEPVSNKIYAFWDESMLCAQIVN